MFRHLLSVAIIAPILIAATLHAQSQKNEQDAAALYQKGLNLLTGSSQSTDYLGAVQYFHQSAEKGYAPANVALGYLYETGLIVARNPTQAMDCYKQAAQQGDSLAEWLVGRLIYSGAVPPQDLNEAADWFGRSAAQGNPFGAYLLGMVQLQRDSYAAAAQSFESAAKQGLPQAQYQLAVLLRDGEGIKQNKFEAYVWFLVSSDGGYGGISDNDLKFLESDLGSIQVAAAKTKAREYETKYARTVVAHGCTGWSGEFDDVPAPPPIELQKFCY